jgi:tRNA threonylcarbamoyladenosine biosynthesis protein TsaB
LKILAIDTSCRAASVCVAETSEAGIVSLAAECVEANRAEALAPMVERVVVAAGGGMASLERLAVTVGPGSFTGIRIGLSLARAMGLALKIPVVGVSTLAAFAASFFADSHGSAIASVVDARHGSVYFQLFDAFGSPLAPPRVLTLLDAVRAIGSGPARVAGDAAEALAAEARRSGLAIEALLAASSPDALAVARLGTGLDPKAAPPRPVYVKAPDARPIAEAVFGASPG